MKKILILHGPNLNLLGLREPEVYGKLTLNDINQRLVSLGEEIGVEIRTSQANGEGELIDALHEASEWADGVVFNPGAYTHTSFVLRDAVSAIDLPVVEVHISNVDAREAFRHKSLIAPACVGRISGFGWQSYTLAIRALVENG
jgi:3-dehydroquinate dehydratase-2